MSQPDDRTPPLFAHEARILRRAVREEDADALDAARSLQRLWRRLEQANWHSGLGQIGADGITDGRMLAAVVATRDDAWRRGQPSVPGGAAACRHVVSGDGRFRVDGDARIGWHVCDTLTRRELAHYQHEPGLDAYRVLQRWLRQEEHDHARAELSGTTKPE